MKNKQSLNAVHFRMSSGFLVILRASVNITVAQVSADALSLPCPPLRLADYDYPLHWSIDQ